jgi:hypothetical protein
MSQMKIQEAVKFILNVESIITKDDLDQWCGAMGRQKMYAYVAQLAPEHWQTIQFPKERVRFTYEILVKGFKLYKE